MVIIKGNAQREIDAMKAEGKVVELTFQTTAEIDCQLAGVFALIKEDFGQKQKASWAEINKRESITAEI